MRHGAQMLHFRSGGMGLLESLMIAEGSATILTRGGDEVAVSIGDSVLMPACAGDYRVEPEGRCVILRIFVPDVEEEIVRALESKGVSKDAIGAIVF